MEPVDFKIIGNPIKGIDLINIFPTYAKHLYPDFIGENPKDSLQRVKKKFGKKPNISGNNIDGIRLIRDALFKVAKSERNLNPFVITASHTHWINPKPIIYKFDKKNKRYLIGQHNIDSGKTYYPVSFVFDNKKYLPYEWLGDENIFTGEYKSSINVIREVTKNLNITKYPFGLSIDFRFKKNLFDKPIPTVELPIDENTDKYFGYSQIITQKHFAESSQTESTEQVGWHPFSDKLLKLNKSELKVLEELRTYLKRVKNKDFILDNIRLG